MAAEFPVNPMAAQFTPEQLGQLEQLFATRLAQQAEAQRAEVENQVGARIQQLQELAQSQYAAGTNLEQQLQEAQAELASTRPSSHRPESSWPPSRVAGFLETQRSHDSGRRTRP